MHDRKLLTVDELAKRLACSSRAIWKWAAMGRLPAPVRIGRSVRWDSTVIDSWIANGCNTNDDECAPQAAR